VFATDHVHFRDRNRHEANILILMATNNGSEITQEKEVEKTSELNVSSLNCPFPISSCSNNELSRDLISFIHSKYDLTYKVSTRDLDNLVDLLSQVKIQLEAIETILNRFALLPDIVKRIFHIMPLNSFYRLRVVSKEWNKIADIVIKERFLMRRQRAQDMSNLKQELKKCRYCSKSSFASNFLLHQTTHLNQYCPRQWCGTGIQVEYEWSQSENFFLICPKCADWNNLKETERQALLGKTVVSECMINLKSEYYLKMVDQCILKKFLNGGFLLTRNSNVLHRDLQCNTINIYWTIQTLRYEDKIDQYEFCQKCGFRTDSNLNSKRIC
jgi:hypothetical protein